MLPLWDDRHGQRKVVPSRSFSNGAGPFPGRDSVYAANMPADSCRDNSGLFRFRQVPVNSGDEGIGAAGALLFCNIPREFARTS